MHEVERKGEGTNELRRPNSQGSVDEGYPVLEHHCVVLRVGVLGAFTGEDDCRGCEHRKQCSDSRMLETGQAAPPTARGERDNTGGGDCLPRVRRQLAGAGRDDGDECAHAELPRSGGQREVCPRRRCAPGEAEGERGDREQDADDQEDAGAGMQQEKHSDEDERHQKVELFFDTERPVVLEGRGGGAREVVGALNREAKVRC